MLVHLSYGSCRNQLAGQLGTGVAAAWLGASVGWLLTIVRRI